MSWLCSLVRISLCKN